MEKIDRTDFIELRSKLKENLKPARFEHTLGVEYTAAALAMVHGADIEKAELAGLLHDCAKHLYDDTKVSPAFHAPEVAQELYGIDDPEILSAIKWHTTGKADMSLLDKIIFVADFIEPGRKNIPILDTVRKVAFEDITYAVYLISERTLEYLKKSGFDIDEHTQECYEFLKENGIHDR